VLDEPALVIALEPYGDPSPTAWSPTPAAAPDLWDRLRLGRRRLTDLAQRGATSVSRDGLAPTAHKGLDKVRRRLGS